MIRGGLFTRDFLAEGIMETPAWKALNDDKVAAVEQTLRRLFTTILAKKQPTEADTEKYLIWPTLEARRLATKSRSDVPHSLLFLDDAAELLRLDTACSTW